MDEKEPTQEQMDHMDETRIDDPDHAARVAWEEKVHHDASNALNKVSDDLLAQGTEPSHDHSGAQAHHFSLDEKSKADRDAARAEKQYDEDHSEAAE